MTSSYRLADGEALHREHPRTYSIPRRDRRRAAPVGALAKLVFELPEPIDGCGAERMWCRVEARTPEGYVGVLDSQPRYLTGLAPGDRVGFEPRHIIALRLDGEGTLRPRVGVGLDVLRHGAWPAWVVRVAATAADDSGWRVFSAAEAEAEDAPRVRAVSAATLFRAWAVLDSVVEADGVGRWRWDEPSLEFVPAEDVPRAIVAAAARGLGPIHRQAPAATLRAIVTRRALEEPPRHAQRLPPTAGHDDDSGWCVFVGDEPQAYLDDPDNSVVVPLGRLLHLYPYLERVLGEEAEAVHAWDEDAGDWVVTDEGDGE